MNVGFVSNVVAPYVTGGAERRIHEIGKRLVAEGHEVTVYTRHYWDGPTRTTNDGMTYHAVAPERDLYAGERRSITEALEFSTRLLVPLRRTVGAHDVLVVSVFPYFPVPSAQLATLGTGIPLVTTWHEVWGDYWEEYLGHLAPFGKAVEWTVANTPQHPVAVSGVTADRLARIGPDRDHVEVVPNGIDVDRIRATEPAEDGFDVLFAGRFIADKHVDLAIEAFDRLEHDDLTFGIVGDGPENDSLRELAATTDAADRITFLGFLEEYDDVLAHMRAADVFVSPSTREGFGITYAEAMAAGCTVVGADHPESAASEVIGDAGILAEPSLDGVTTALERALGDARLETDPQESVERFDWDRVAARATDAYRRAIDGEW